MAWADIVANLQLNVDKRAAERQIESIDTSKAGKAGGKTYGGAFGQGALPPMRDAHARFGRDAEKQARATGTTVGASFGDHFRIGIAKTLSAGGPGIIGLDALKATAAGLVASLAASLPAAVAAAGGLAGMLGGGATIAIGAKILIGDKKDMGPLYAQAQQVAKAFTDAMDKAATGMLAPLKQAFGQIPGIIRSLTPAMTQVFAGAGTMIAPLLSGVTQLARTALPLLGQMFRATAPLIQPLMNGLDQLIQGLLPPLIGLIQAAGPAMAAFGQILGGLGRDLGAMFTAMTPAIRASSVIFQSLAGVLSALFPVIGQITASLAQALVPVFGAFAAAVKALMPILTVIGKVIGDLAAAILADLAWALGAVAELFQAIAPALAAFARALGGVFTMLENTGAFQALAAALTQILPLLAQLVTAILRGLTPILPLVVGFLTQMATVLAGQMAASLAAILPPLTQLATAVLQTLAQILPVVLPVLTRVLGLFTGALATVIQSVADALNAFINALPPGTLGPIATGLLAVWGAFKLLSAAPTIILALNKALLLLATANPFGLIITGIVLVGTALYELWTRSATFRDIVIGAFNAVKTAVTAVAQWFAGPFVSFFTGAWSAITGAFNTAIAVISGVFSTIRNAIAGPFTTWWAANGEAVKAIWNGIWTGLAAVVRPLWNAVVTIVQAGWTVLHGAFTAGWAVISAAWTAGWGLLSAIVKTAIGMITAVVGTLWGVLKAAFTAGMAVVQAVWNAGWAVISNTLKVIWAAIQAVVKVAWDVIVGIFTVAINLLTGRWGAAWTAMHTMAVQVWNAIKAFFTTWWAAVQALFAAALNLIKALLSAAWTAISGTATAVWNGIRAFFTAWWVGIQAAFGAAVNAVKSLLSAAWNSISATARTIWGGIASFFTGWWNTLRGAVSAAATGIHAMLDGVWNGIKATATTIWNGIKTAISAVWNGIKAVVGTPVNAVIGIINAVGHGVNIVVHWVTGKNAFGEPVLQPVRWQTGGLLPGYGGGDTVPAWITGSRGGPALLEPGELIMPKQAARDPRQRALAAEYGVPGFQGGGVAGSIINGALHTIPGLSSLAGLFDIAKSLIPGPVNAAISALEGMPGKVTGLVRGAGQWAGTMAKAGVKLATLPITKVQQLLAGWLKDNMGGNGAAIVAYAKSFLGKIPYVWGGTAVPGGADCSGFVQAIYRHFGISAPRTSEAQGAWVRRTGPQPGGLAFYHSPAGGADPGHVAIVADAASVISQGGGMGPKMQALRYLPLLWTGIPPGGFPIGANVTTNYGKLAPGVQNFARALAQSMGWPLTESNLNAIAAWENQEGGISHNNPLNTTQPYPGATNFNSVGVKTYPNLVAGLEATIQTLRNGLYGGILSAFSSGRASLAVIEAAISRSPWGTHFARGGLLSEPVTGIGRYSRTLYHFGEAGREWVIPEAQMRRGGDGDSMAAVVARLDRLIDATRAAPAATGRHVGDRLDATSTAYAFRSRYPAGGI